MRVCPGKDENLLGVSTADATAGKSINRATSRTKPKEVLPQRRKDAKLKPETSFALLRENLS
jgi:hypothetical protein